jgi:hemoglobin-like flavoprotein
MTPEQIHLVQQSLPAIRALRDRAPARFHEHFTVMDPAPRTLFAGADMRRQGAVLIHTIATAVEALRSGDHGHAATVLRPYHLSHAIGAHHFRSAGKALVRALEQELEPCFTRSLRRTRGRTSRAITAAARARDAARRPAAGGIPKPRPLLRESAARTNGEAQSWERALQVFKRKPLQ